MLFNSFEFLFLFLPITLRTFYVLGRWSPPVAIGWLALASVFFYGWWSPVYITLLLLSIIFNYCCGVLMSKLRQTSLAYLIFIFAISVNIIVLAFFKYIDLLFSSINSTIGTTIPALGIELPIGISFFTFTQIAFLVDTYRRVAKEYNIVHYLLFVSYFPHLIAGPVLHHKQMMPQFSQNDTFTLRLDNISVGLAFLVIGLSKKILIADQFSPFASGMFDGVAKNGVAPHLFLSWAGVLAYTFQIYFDFSGYSDMAIAISRLFGVKLPLNFNSPYKAMNIIDFWRRWHMSLSKFLRDYLYFALGGNRKGVFRRYVNLFITMLLGGLWHGASWTFLAWGGLHGFYLIINHAWNAFCEELKLRGNKSYLLWNTASWLLTFISVMVAWVFFRAADFTVAQNVLKGMIGLNGVWMPASLKGALGHYGDLAASYGVVFNNHLLAFRQDDLSTSVGDLVRFLALALAGFALLACPNSQQIMNRYRPALEEISSSFATVKLGPVTGFAAGVLFLLCLANLNHRSEFLYFQF